MLFIVRPSRRRSSVFELCAHCLSALDKAHRQSDIAPRTSFPSLELWDHRGNLKATWDEEKKVTHIYIYVYISFYFLFYFIYLLFLFIYIFIIYVYSYIVCTVSANENFHRINLIYSVTNQFLSKMPICTSILFSRGMCDCDQFNRIHPLNWDSFHPQKILTIGTKQYTLFKSILILFTTVSIFSNLNGYFSNNRVWKFWIRKIENSQFRERHILLNVQCSVHQPPYNYKAFVRNCYEHLITFPLLSDNTYKSLWSSINLGKLVAGTLLSLLLFCRQWKSHSGRSRND